MSRRSASFWLRSSGATPKKGQVGRPLKIMVAGIPNVGKSTFINQIAGRKGAKAENRPGVTRGKQWVTIDTGLFAAGHTRHSLAAL